MELQWLEDPLTGERTLQYREQGSNGIYGPAGIFYDTGWVDVPVVKNIPILTDEDEV